MPLKSQAQRRYLWATNPKLAKKFEKETPDNKKLPEKVADHVNDRAAERTDLTDAEVEKMRSLVKSNQSLFRKGSTYSVKVPNRGYFVVGDVGKKRKNHVVKTVLGKDMVPPGLTIQERLLNHREKMASTILIQALHAYKEANFKPLSTALTQMRNFVMAPNQIKNINQIPKVKLNAPIRPGLKNNLNELPINTKVPKQSVKIPNSEVPTTKPTEVPVTPPVSQVPPITPASTATPTPVTPTVTPPVTPTVVDAEPGSLAWKAQKSGKTVKEIQALQAQRAARNATTPVNNTLLGYTKTRSGSNIAQARQARAAKLEKIRSTPEASRIAQQNSNMAQHNEAVAKIRSEQPAILASKEEAAREAARKAAIQQEATAYKERQALEKANRDAAWAKKQELDAVKAQEEAAAVTPLSTKFRNLGLGLGAAGLGTLALAASEASPSKHASIEYRGKSFPGYNQPVASDRAEKKKMVLAKDGNQVKLIHFGQKGYRHNYSNEAKQNYLKRSAGIVGKNGLTKNDKLSANYWARRELWPKNEPADGTAKDK